MGAVTFSIDPRLVSALLQAVPLEVFVETGTFRGDTLEEVKDHFREIYSIELSREYFEESRERFADESHIEVLLGASATLLPDVLARRVGKSVLIFLDAHWCVAEDTAGECSQCPLIEELQAIGTLNSDSIVVIDDARLFLSTPPVPHEVSQWPVFGDVLKSLSRLSEDHDVMVVNDYILFFPIRIREVIASYARHYGVDWLDVFNGIKEKEKEIETLRRTCDERGEELKAKEEALASKETDWFDIRQRLSEAEGALASKDHTLSEAQQELEDKEEVIRELGRSVHRYRLVYSGFNFFRAGSREVRRLITPKLGQLEHHPPMPLRVPGPYACSVGSEELPTISIVTPSFQQAKFLERTVQSVFNQDYPDLEYFVQDGGSDDGSVEVLERYADRLDGFESVSDRGQADAINRGFARTSGGIMCWLNSDDMLLAGALHCVGDYFARHPEVDVVYGNRVLIDENDMEIGRWILPPHDDAVLSWADFVPQETLFWRRSIWEKTGEYVDEGFRFALDWDLLLRFRDAGARIVRLPRLLGAFRVHESQKTSANIEESGFMEMDRLRKRCTGRDEINERRIRRAIGPYMVRHVAHDLCWRIRERLWWSRSAEPELGTESADR